MDAQTNAKYQFPIKYDDIIGEIEFAIVEKEGVYYLSDQEKTIAYLDKVFELSEPDVIKNLVAIMKHMGAVKKGDEILIELVDWDNNRDFENSSILKETKYRLFSCVSFMNNMKIFYV